MLKDETLKGGASTERSEDQSIELSSSPFEQKFADLRPTTCSSPHSQVFSVKIRACWA